MPTDQNGTQTSSNTATQPTNPTVNVLDPANSVIGKNYLASVPRIARMRIVSSPKYRIQANFRPEATELMREVCESTQNAIKTCYSQRTFTQAAYESNMQSNLSNPKITVISYGTIEKIDQFGNPWEDWMDAPGAAAHASLAKAPEVYVPPKPPEVYVPPKPPEVYVPPKPPEVYGPSAQWELKSQVNDDVLKFTRYSDGRCIVEVILPKEKERTEDQYHVYSITDSVRELIDNPENSEYGLDKDALRYINYGKDAFDEFYKNGKIFPPLSAGSDEYYAIVLHNLRSGEAWVKGWKQTFEDVAAFNIIAGAVIGAAPGASGTKTPKGASGAGLDKKLMNELSESGVKYNADDVVMITKNSDGKLLWLENGNGSAGLKHIIDGKATNFADRGITDIPKFLEETLRTKPVRIGSNSKGNYAEYIMNGKEYTVAYGTNGYIVSFYPSGN